METNAVAVLTPCQEIALQEIVDWAKTPGGSCWTLSGAAGTGKTFITQEILRQIKQTAICVSAPTHKAKKIIAAVTKYHAETLQALLGMSPNTELEDFKINKVKFDQQNKPKLKYYSFLVIDEASMIGTELFTLLMKEAKTIGAKILFIGDHIQLPPVGENISPVFDVKHVKGVSVLRTPARQKPSNPLNMLLMALRMDIDPSSFQDVFPYMETAILTFGGSAIDVEHARYASTRNKMFGFIVKRFPNVWNDDEGYKIHNVAAEFAEHVTEIFTKFETSNPDFCKILSYTNSRVAEYNRVIRRQVLGNPASDVVVGDIIMAYTSITRYPEKESILTNSEEYIVTNVESSETTYGIRVWEVLMQTADNLVTAVNVVQPEDYNSFLAVHNLALDKAKNHKDWVGYYRFKNEHLVLQSLNEMYKTENLPKKDLDYSFGITVHKSQGSTYENVVVDGDNIRSSYEITKTNLTKTGKWNQTAQQEAGMYTLKLMYVAISRAKKGCIMVIT